MVVKGNLVDIFNRRIYSAEIAYDNGIITRIKRIDGVFQNFILPGFVDSHVHIESSMSIPSVLSSILSSHGTIAAVCDPHEIANVCGVEGINYMINDASMSLFKYFFGVPSCVPAASVDVSGAVIDSMIIDNLLSRNDLFFLAEMMNYPGVVSGDTEVIKKIDLAKKYNKPIDGHAPGLLGDDLVKYIAAGVSTDHECSSIDEAREKIKLGMKVLIREGSAARNFDNLLPLVAEFPDSVMFCTDDAHPDFIEKRHIDYLVKEAITKGYDLFDVLKVACLNAVLHYSLPVGLLREGDSADFIVVDSLENFNILQTVSNGVQVYPLFEDVLLDKKIAIPNNFNASYVNVDDFKIESLGSKIKMIEIFDGELWTNSLVVDNWSNSEFVSQSLSDDYLKLAVLDRYSPNPPSLAFVKGFGFKKLAIATSIAHDSHNIICVGTHDELMTIAMNEVVKNRGGIAVTDGLATFVLPLAVAGLMYSGPFSDLLEQYNAIESFITQAKPSVKAPLMTLSFLSLIVIPELKLASKGLFDVNSFEYTSLFSE